MDNMFEREHDAFDLVENYGHMADIDCETLAAAAAFDALGRFEQQLSDDDETSETVDYDYAKETLADLVKTSVDRWVETKGLDYVDSDQAKRVGIARVHEMYERKYGGEEN